MTRTLYQDVDALHDSFIAAINLALAENDLERAEELARAYDREAIQLLAEREGKTHLLPIRRRTPQPSGLGRLAKRLTTSHAA
ncbi:MAG: hypothetical protein ACXVYL_18915 [Oryzihumus sp.]